MDLKAILRRGTSIAAFAIGAAASAQAQPVPAAQAEAAASAAPAADGIADIIVTARRREENLQSVPVAITAVTPDTMRKQNVTTLQDVARLVPSLSTYSPYVIDTYVVLRGQGSYLPTGVPAVTSYLDEVPLPGVVGGPGFFYDLQSVQVLKGAQGTLFGRNSTGGALLQETARPENSFGGFIQAGTGNYSNFDATGAVNLPVVDDKVLLRLAFNYQRRDGFTHIISDPQHPNGIDLNDRNLKAGRATLLLKPIEGLTNETVVDAYSFKEHGENTILTNVNPAFFDGLSGTFGPTLANTLKQQFLGFLAEQQARGPRTQIAASVYAPNSKKSFGVVNKTSIDITDDLSFKNIFAYIRVSAKQPFEGDGTSSANIDYGPVRAPRITRQFTEEAQLQGSLLDNKLKFTTGIFYLSSPKSPFYVVDRTVFFGFAAAQEQTRVYETSKAVFGQATYAIADALNVTVGGRYTSDRRIGESRLLDSPTGSGGPFVCVNPPIGPGAAGYDAADPCLASKVSKSKRATGNVSVDYQLQSGLLVYGAVRRGYRAGGPNVQTILPVNASYNPEVLTDFELGLKSDFHLGDVPIRANLAAYHSYVKGLQVSASVTEAPRPNTLINLVLNAPGATFVNGGEIELTARLTPEFTVNVGGSITDMSGKLPSNVVRSISKYIVNLSADYNRELGGNVGTLDVNASANWRSGLFIAQDPGPGAFQRGYALVNLSVGLKGILGSKFDAEAYATNLLNKTYRIGAYNSYFSLGYTAANYAEPRIFGGRIRYSF